MNETLLPILLGIALAIVVGWCFSGLVDVVDQIHEREE